MRLAFRLPILLAFLCLFTRGSAAARLNPPSPPASSKLNQEGRPSGTHISDEELDVPLQQRSSALVRWKTGGSRGGASWYSKKGSSLGMVLLPWLYFMAVQVNTATMPKYIHWILSSRHHPEDGNAQRNAQTSSLSATVYGNMCAIDSLFTFFSVNFLGCRIRPHQEAIHLLLLRASSSGSGAGWQGIEPVRVLYLSAALDGLTSCMLSQAQAHIADCSLPGADLSASLSRFQGIAIGSAFMIGIPLGAEIARKYSLRAPLLLSSALCAVNCALIATMLPSTPTGGSTVAEGSNGAVVLKNFWLSANPVGAAVMLSRSGRLLVGSLTYLLVCSAQAGMQSCWVNYLQFRFGWSATLAGSTLAVVGLVVALLPSMIIPLMGVERAIQLCLLLHAMSVMVLGSISVGPAVFLAMPFFAAGASSMPMLLGYLTQQVPFEEVGALQGAADTVRTIASVIGSPLISRLLAYSITVSNSRSSSSIGLLSDAYRDSGLTRNLKSPGLALFVAGAFSFTSFLLFTFLR
eukprot:gene27339-36101_t